MKKIYVILLTITFNPLQSSDLESIMPASKSNANTWHNLKRKVQHGYKTIKQKTSDIFSNVKHRFGTHRKNFQELKQRYKENMQLLEMYKSLPEDIADEQKKYEEAQNLLHDAIKVHIKTKKELKEKLKKEKDAYMAEIAALEKNYKQQLAQYEKSDISTDGVGKIMSNFAQTRKKALIQYRKKIDQIKENSDIPDIPNTDDLLPKVEIDEDEVEKHLNNEK